MHIYIISHYFIPFAGVGTKRIAYLVKYLLEKGNQITLFKANNNYYPEITDAKIHHSNLTIINVSVSGISDRNWAKAYLNKIQENIDLEQKPDLVIFSAGPFFYLSISTIIRERYSIPYIIDFRDTFLNTKGFYERHAKFALRRFVRYLLFCFFDVNKSAILRADSIITVTESEKKVLIRHYGKSIADKIEVVRNGFDDNLLDSIETIEKPIDIKNGYKIGVFGKFAYYNADYAHTFINTVISLSNLYPATVYLVGKKEDEFNEYIQNGHKNVSLVQTGYLSYTEGLQILSNCQILVLNNRSSNSHGTKIFDYIALNKPIIAFIHPDSEIADLLRPFNNAFIVTNENECRKAIENILQKKLNCLDEHIDLYNYSRLSQTRIYEHLIHSVIHNNKVRENNK